MLQALCEVFLCVCMCALELPVTTREGTKFKLVFVCMPACFRLKKPPPKNRDTVCISVFISVFIYPHNM